MAAPLRNTNAAKPADQRASGNLNIRTKPVDMDRWKAAAQASGMSLSAWVTIQLNRAAQ